MKNIQEQINELKEEQSQLKGVVSIATVSSRSVEKRTARVIWENGTVSQQMEVLRRGDNWMPDVKQKVVCLRRKDGGGFILGGL